MIDRDDIARAVRDSDAMAEEIGREATLTRRGVDPSGVEYVADQRALRVGLAMEGRKVDPAKPVVKLSEPVDALQPAFGALWVDGFLAGLTARHDPSHDIPGIGVDEPAWIVGVTASCTKLRRFATEDEAVTFVGTLEGVEDGIYYIDPPTSED